MVTDFPRARYVTISPFQGVWFLILRKSNGRANHVGTTNQLRYLEIMASWFHVRRSWARQLPLRQATQFTSRRVRYVSSSVQPSAM